MLGIASELRVRNKEIPKITQNFFIYFVPNRQLKVGNGFIKVGAALRDQDDATYKSSGAISIKTFDRENTMTSGQVKMGKKKLEKEDVDEDAPERSHVRECPVREEDVNLEGCVGCIYSEVEVDSTDGRYSVECEYPTQTKEMGFDPEIVFDEPVDGASIKKLKDDKDEKKKDKKKDDKKDKKSEKDKVKRTKYLVAPPANAVREKSYSGPQAGQFKAAQVLLNSPAVVTTDVKAAEGLMEGDIVVVTDEHQVQPNLSIYEVLKV